MSGRGSSSQDLYPIYVVVINWNLPEVTIECVDSVLVAAPGGLAVILVDNGSTDDSIERFESHFGRSVVVVRNSENLGFAGGVNVGISRALAEGAGSILLLNNDTVVQADMIDRLVQAAGERTRAGIVGPVIYYHDLPQRIWRFGDREYRWLPVPVRVSERALARAGDCPFRVDYVTACGMLIRRAVFDSIGLLDDRYFIYYEDADFCRCARQAGWEIWCVPAARMWHKVSLTMRRQKPATRYLESWGRARFYRKHPHGPSRALTLSYLVGRALLTTLHDLAHAETSLIRPLWLGTVHGCSGTPSRFREFMT